MTHSKTLFHTNSILFLAMLVLLLFSTATVAHSDAGKRKDVKNYINQLVKQHGFDKKELTSMFNKVKINQKIIDAITRPAEAKPWYKYRPIFLTESRIEGGVKFWQENEPALQRAYETYGVPPEIVVAIIGVETKYGKYKGKYPIMESLTTLAFAYPKRAKFFRKELTEYLLMTREESMDPMELKGSYAGAMGKPQFIASSYRNYAVDFDGDGKRDILNSTTDAIGSVANYFKRHRWQAGEPITTTASVKGKQYKRVVKKGIKPSFSLNEMQKKGITIDGQHDAGQKAALIELDTKNGGNEHWIGFNNFYVITRYNHSELYAMAVYQLSQEIIKQRKKSLAAKNQASSS